MVHGVQPRRWHERGERNGVDTGAIRSDRETPDTAVLHL